MGPRSHHDERNILIALVAIAVGTLLPAYPILVTKMTARGVEVSWLGHVAIIGGLLLFALFSMAVFACVIGMVMWILDRIRGGPDKPAV